MELGIAGKVALVSGGSKGMGRAVALDLANEGCKVVIAARGAEAVEEVVREIRAKGQTAAGVSADMTSEAGIERAVAFARETFGAPDIVVANVYGPTHGFWDEVKIGDLREAYEHLVIGPAILFKAVVPHMREQGWGRLVTIGGVNAKLPHADLGLLTANITRVGSVALNKSLSNELGKFGITVNTVAPGGFFTDRYKTYMQKRAEEEGEIWDEAAARQRPEQPIPRLGDPAEIAAMVAFIASDRAGYITGQMLLVDGGRTGTVM